MLRLFPKRWLLWLVLSWWVAATAASAAFAQSSNLDVSGDSVLQEVTWAVEPEGAVVVSAQMVLVLSRPMVEALHQGIPVYFVAQASMTRTRWWLWDKKDIDAHRFWRLSYQPLTRVWRVQVSQESSKHTDSSLGLAQYFDSLDQALAVMQRISNWKIGERSQLAAGQLYEAQFSLGVDQERLPRPLQFDAQGRNDWDLLLRTSQSSVFLKNDEGADTQ